MTSPGNSLPRSGDFDILDDIPNRHFDAAARLRSGLAKLGATWRQLNYQRDLLKRGEQAIDEHRKDWFTVEGCKAITLALIKSGKNTRNEIVASVPWYHQISHRHVAYILDEMTGIDPRQHLWRKGQGGVYTLNSR